MSASTITNGQRPGPCPVISTGRLVLRPHRTSDADCIAGSLSDYRVSRMLAREPALYHRQDAIDFINRQTSGQQSGWSLAITMDDDLHIGCIGLELRHGLWHADYWLNRFYWGKGIVTEAASVSLDRFFRRMPDVEMHSGVFVDNPASLAIQKKLGFRITGCSQVYAMARNEMVAHIETVLVTGDQRRP